MHGQNILLERLKRVAPGRPLAIVIGSALSVTFRRDQPPLGVPGVGRMIEFVRTALRAADLEDHLDDALKNVAPAGHYQAAFDLADALLGTDAVNAIVHAAVLEARQPGAPTDFADDGDPQHWHIPRGTAALGRLLVAGAHPFTGPVLTTNFDPLLSLAIEAAGGDPDRRVLSTDGHLAGAADSKGRPRVVHWHGYWRDAHTLHTPAQLTRERTALRGALRTLLAGHTVLVTGYGGWDDVFMKALAEIAAESNNQSRVLWALFGDEAKARHENKALLDTYEGRPGIRFYCGVDAHALFEALSPAPTIAATPSPKPAARPTTSATPAPDARPIKMGQPGFAVPTFTLARGKMIGGEALIARLHDLLADGEAGIGQAAAVGLGGLGKSRLAWEYAHAHRADYPGGVLWFDADTQADLDGQLADIARTLRWVGPASDDKGALDVARPALRDLRDALIIFDNVEDIERVRHLRPQQGCAFLVTSRQPQNMRVLDMKVLPPDAGVALLEQVSGRPLDDPADREAARAISVWADGLPLALELVGAYMGSRPMAKWPDTLRRLEAHALKARPLKPAKAGLDEPIHGGQTVDAALQLEPQLLDEYPALGPALDMLSGLAPTSMGIDLLSTLVDAEDPEELTEALEVACTLRIVNRTGEDQPRYRMHRLVRAVYRASRSETSLDAAAMARLVQWFRDKRHEQTGTTAFAGEGDHLEAARALCDAMPALHAPAVLRWLEANIPNARGEYRAALTLVEQAQAAWEGDADAPLALEMAVSRAVLQGALGDVRGALAALETIDERTAHVAVAPDVGVELLMTLGHQQHLLGRRAPARMTAARALALAENTWGAEHWRTAEARSQWAVYTAQADSSDARRATDEARRALDQLRAVSGPGDIRILSARYCLGLCLGMVGQHSASIEVGRHALAEYEHYLGPEHPRTLHVMKNLAMTFNTRGDRRSARECAQRALSGYQQLYGAEHPDVVMARLELIWSAIDRVGTRQVALRLKTLRNSLAPDHPERSRLDRAIHQLTQKPKSSRGRGKKRKR